MGTELPIKDFMQNAGRDEGEMKTGLEQMVAFPKQTIGGGKQASFTISSGTIVPTSPWVNVETEGAASVDDLDHIDPANFVEGNLIILFLTNSSHHVIVKHNAGGEGQIGTDTNADVKITDGAGGLVLLCVDSGGGVLTWVVMDRWFRRGTERLQSQKFTASGNFTVPSMIHEIYTQGIGGGGGGGEGGDATNDGADGGIGSSTVLTSHITYQGGAIGKGGLAASNGGWGGDPGSGGNRGEAGGASHPGQGGSVTFSPYGNQGRGGSGGDAAAGTEAGGGGGGGPSFGNRQTDGPFTVTPGDTIVVTIGSGGTGGTGSSAGLPGASGEAGELLILW